MSSVVTPKSQHAASGKALQICSHGGVFPVALLLTVLLSQLAASIFSLSTFLNVVMMVSITMVWLDGLSTDIGLKRGLEETNHFLRALQRHAGNYAGLILSRMLPTAVILYIALILQTPYLLIPITSIFLVCNLSNLMTIINRHHLDRY